MMKGRHHHNRFNKNDNEIARRLFEESIVMDPNYADAYVFLAWTYYHEAFIAWTKTPGKSFEKAVAAQKKALSLDPANSLVNALSGTALYNAGKFKEAIPLLKTAIRINPKHPGWYPVILGFSYLFMGQNETAIIICTKMLNREPSSADAHALLGSVLIAAGKPEEAVGMFEKALGLNPSPPNWYVGNLSIARVGTGQPEEAIAMLREALSRNPDNAAACRYMASLLTYEGRHEESLSMAKKAVSLEEMSPSPTPNALFYGTLGTSYHFMGQYEEAIAAFKKGISLWPEYVYGHIGLTASYSLAGRMEDARAQAVKALKINPKITLEDIAKNGYYNYKKGAKERFINALRKAGLK